MVPTISDPTPDPGPAAAERLCDLGEWELLRRLARFAPPGQLDDDAALLAPDGRRSLVVNTDLLVEGVHFSDHTMAATDLGWRAAAANLSDLAAMGCREVVGLTVGLVAPSATPWPWVEGIYRGLAEALDRYGGVLLGGDCSGGDQRLLAITALGSLGPGPIRRADGRPGDHLVTTGPHGLSRLGLALALGELSDPAGQSLDPSLQRRALAAHRRPLPRLDAVEALERTRPSSSPWRIGGTDSSDGLVAAVANIARASGCQALLEQGQLPLDPAMAGLPQARAWCLAGGEDFELVLALEPTWADQLVAALPGTSRIGELRAQGTASAAPASTQGAPGPMAWADSSEPFPEDLAGYTHYQ